jgi:hypothetical protein
MKAKTFLILLVAAGLLAALALLRFGEDDQRAGLGMGDKLFADLPVNQVAVVIVADAQNQTTLTKGAAVWQVEARNGYPADFDELRDTIVKLSRLTIGRSFSGSAESLVRLSLLPPSDPNASARGQQITLKDGSGEILADILLGKARETDNGGGGQYLKKVDEDTVYLVDGDFRFLKTEPTEWLEKDILNIKADAIESVACYLGDDASPRYVLSRPEPGQDARLTSVPQGRTADQAKIDQVLDALAPLTLDDVRAAGTPPAAAPDQYRLVYSLYDGRQITVFPALDGEDKYTVQIAARQTDKPDISGNTAVNVAGNDDASSQDAQADGSKTPPAKTAQQINDALSPWVFTIKKWQFDSLITQPDILLEALKTEGEGSS